MSPLPPLPQANIPWLPPKPSPSTLALHVPPISSAAISGHGPLSGGVRLGLPAVATTSPAAGGVNGPVNQVWTPPSSKSQSGAQSSAYNGMNDEREEILVRIGMKRPHSTLKESETPTSASSALPLPLPSKRFRKTPGPKAVLIPVEQLPVYPLPSPPPISDPVILETVFNHQSLFPRSKGRFEELPSDTSASRQSARDPLSGATEAKSEGGIKSAAGMSDGAGREREVAGHYEKLEHVGDSLLGMIVTTWLHEDRPRLTCGTATKLKAHLVSNATLSHLSGLYGFPQRLRGAPDQLPVLRAQTDVRAALVEAYIAGVYFSYPPHERFTIAMGVLNKWLREMYEPLYEFFFNYMRQEYENHHLSLTSISSLPSGMTSTTTKLLTEDEMAAIDAASQGMANLLRTYCQRQGKDCRFEEERYETHCGILWGIKCFVDGRQVGEATRSGRRGAKNVAAWEGCKAFGLIEADPVNGAGDSQHHDGQARIDLPGATLPTDADQLAATEGPSAQSVSLECQEGDGPAKRTRLENNSSSQDNATP